MRGTIETLLDRLLPGRAAARPEAGAEAPPSEGAGSIRMPLLADWGWRPEIWRSPLSQPSIEGVESGSAFGGEAKIFHDCARSVISIGQVQDEPGTGPAPFGLRIDVGDFEGSFLSLALDLPDGAAAGLRLNHVVRLDTAVELERPIKVFARLNVRHGPNTEHLVRDLPLGSDDVMVEFDLAYSNMNEKRVDGAWIDLIFDRPEANRIVLRDLTVCRRPRAEL